jgi:hypothetical protein
MDFDDGLAVLFDGRYNTPTGRSIQSLKGNEEYFNESESVLRTANHKKTVLK